MNGGRGGGVVVISDLVVGTVASSFLLNGPILASFCLFSSF